MSSAEIGLIGLGTMGAALALNIAEKGFAIAVWNRTTAVTRQFHADAGALAPKITPTDTLADLVAAIRPPRAIILMVPAGQAVDDQIEALRTLLDGDDLIIDAGNALFHDTNRRAADADEAVDAWQHGGLRACSAVRKREVCSHHPGHRSCRTRPAG